MKSKHPACVSIFGSSGAARILWHLAKNPHLRFSKLQLAKQTGIARTTVDDALPRLVKEGLAVVSEKVGPITLYTLNDTPAAEAWYEFVQKSEARRSRAKRS